LGLIALLLSLTAQAGVVDADFPAVSYVSFQSPNLLSPNEPLTISGVLRIPVGGAENLVSDAPAQKIPGVVVLHGSSGLDSRGGLYIEALNNAGIATLEIDMWAARGLTGGSDRPALPTLTVPDAFSALRFLAQNPAIDPDRIGILGFSWGGVVTMLSATQLHTERFGGGLKFAAHVAHYPVCWAYSAGLPGIEFKTLTGSPVLIQIGDRDDYDEGAGPCQALAAPFPNVSVNVYTNAYHAWDRLQPSFTAVDPFSHRGLGGEVEFVPNPGKAFQSRSKAVDFFRAGFGME
jgi:dienelactone hydrolase